MSTRHTASCDCGWTGSYDTIAYAAYALRRHSCDAHRPREARAARVATRQAASGPVRECSCPVANHEHGTHPAYVIDQCRCRPCRDAASGYERWRAKQRAYGRQSYVPADRARAHIMDLQRHGMGWKRVAQAAGVETSTVWKILYGDTTRNMPPSRRVRPATEAKILAVTLDLADGAVIDGTGTRRRLQALVALGWSQAKLGDRLDIEAGNFWALMQGTTRPGVTVATARKVSVLYDELWSTPPPGGTKWEKIARANALNGAKRHGWVGPLAWDDATIDDPDATANLGDLTAVRRRGVDLDDLGWLLDTSTYTWDGITARTGHSRYAIERACHRGGRTDLIARLTANTGTGRYAGTG